MSIDFSKKPGMDLDELLSERLDIDVEFIDPSDQEAFALARRNGIGASEAGACLGVTPQWKTAGDIIEDKMQTERTDKDKQVGALPAVRMGVDLEPLILSKAANALNKTVCKPTKMYRLKKYPWLTINYDGLIGEGVEFGVPVEAKVVTIAGDKYFDFGKAGEDRRPNPPAITCDQYCREAAEMIGIPPQYYAQTQQQLMGTSADYAYLAAMRIKDWTLYLFKVYRDEYTQTNLAINSQQIWAQVQKRRDKLNV